MMVLSSDGEVFSWGVGEGGCLGREGEPSTPTLVPNLPGDMARLVCGPKCSGVIDPLGKLLVVGENSSNRLGLDGERGRVGSSLVFKEAPREVGTVGEVSLGLNFSLVLNTRGEVWRLGGEKRGVMRIWSGKEMVMR